MEAATYKPNCFFANRIVDEKTFLREEIRVNRFFFYLLLGLHKMFFVKHEVREINNSKILYELSEVD